MAVPYTFGSATSAIPLSQLDSNFATTITLGNTAIQLGNTVTTLNNMTLANVTVTTISGGTGNAVVYTNSSGAITANSSVIALDASGNLGLGVTPSASNVVTFQVPSGGVITSSGTQTNFAANAVYNAGWKYVASSYACLYQQSNGVHSWSTAASGTAGNAITFTQAMTLDASGNLGVGSTAPSSDGVSGYRNLVIGTSSSSTAGITMLTNNTGSTTQGIVWSRSIGSTNGFVKYDHYYDVLSFGAGGAERARIDSSGNLLVGTTVSPTSSSTSGLQLQNASGVAGRINCGKSGAGTSTAWANYYSGTYVGGMDYSTTATIFNISSDVRLKKDIVNADSASTKIDQIRIVSHGWNYDDAVVDFGVIAQELFLVVPQAVTEGDYGETIEKPWGVDYSKLVPVLIKAHQEQQALITTLTERITALEGAK